MGTAFKMNNIPSMYVFILMGGLFYCIFGYCYYNNNIKMHYIQYELLDKETGIKPGFDTLNLKRHFNEIIIKESKTEDILALPTYDERVVKLLNNYKYKNEKTYKAFFTLDDVKYNYLNDTFPSNYVDANVPVLDRLISWDGLMIISFCVGTVLLIIVFFKKIGL